MRLLWAAVLVLAACGPAGELAPCKVDSDCERRLSCATVEGGNFCLPRCTPVGDANLLCRAEVGEGSRCEKYVGPDSSGYACSKPR
ncbi:MAG TPA: hypothetical protein VGD87_17465 [Archangium sp.]|jgi:hypothetical protein